MQPRPRARYESLVAIVLLVVVACIGIPTAILSAVTEARADAPAGRADAPVGQITTAATVSIAPRWFDPAEAEAIITPFAFYYALHDALVNPSSWQPR
jgi:peptide/nickel transport system substrate-binding protein